MKSIIVGTAGHIDHGKTALVKALTGIDADRLEEEKRRGITIDLGFAHLELPAENGEPLRFGFVDVPGHERFVRNMLAGIGGIDIVLLVIAADEGIKPQTREHFDICRLLGIQHGITVLTKSDLVDSDTLDVVKLEVGDFLRGSFLESLPIVAVSSLKGTGLDQLKKELVRTAASAPARDAAAITRLPIDRVFTMKGFGTVVTGTLVAGTIQKEDELELLPAGRRARVRGVEVHGAVAERAVAGERTAANVVGIEKGDIERGMVLASPALLRASSRFDAKLSLLASAARPLKSGARVHFHAFTAETIATVILHQAKQLEPGKDGFAELRLQQPVLLVPGDRFIIRQFSPVITIGGGVMLDAFPRKLSRAIRVDFLAAMNQGDESQVLCARVSRRGRNGLAISQAIAETGWTRDRLLSVLQGAAAQDTILGLHNALFPKSVFGELFRAIQGMVAEFQKENPLALGIGTKVLSDKMGANAELFDFTIDCLFRAKRLQVVEGGLVRLYGHGVTMKDEEAESKEVIEQAFASAGLKVPALKDVLAGLKIDRARSQKIVTLLLRDKVLIKVSDDLVFHQAALTKLRATVAAQKLKSPKIDVARFKDLTGVSRKYAIPLLEFLDRERVTKRVGDERIIL